MRKITELWLGAMAPVALIAGLIAQMWLNRVLLAYQRRHMRFLLVVEVGTQMFSVFTESERAGRVLMGVLAGSQAVGGAQFYEMGRPRQQPRLISEFPEGRFVHGRSTHLG